MSHRAAALTALILLAAGLCLPATTSRLTGQVVDHQGSPLAGVTVEISSPGLIGGPQTKRTDREGEFAFELLPVAQYAVTASLEGFLQAAGQVRVQLGRVAAITVQMTPEAFAGEILVASQVPVVDVSQVDTSLVLGRDFLQAATVGIDGRSLDAVLGQAPGLPPSEPRVYGSTLGDNNFLIDGVDSGDPMFGTRTLELSLDAIDELSFSTGAFEAEYGRAIGGVVNLVTRSGGNRFTGSADLRYRDDSFIERGEHFDPDTQQSWDRTVSGTLGGPILSDRLWFFVSAEHIASSWETEGVHFPRQDRDWSAFGKATWQLAPSHRAVLELGHNPQETKGPNAHFLIQPSASQTETFDTTSGQAELASVLSDRLLLTARLGSAEVTGTTGPSHGQERSAHFNSDTGVLSNSIKTSIWDRRTRRQLGLDLTWLVDAPAGSHQLKAGAERHDLHDHSASWYTGGGYLEDVTPAAGWTDFNGDGYFNHVVTLPDTRFMGSPWPASRPLNADGRVLSAFLQDAWRPHRTLTVKPGIRFDRVRLDNHFGEQVARMDRWQPRLGLAWDLTGRARHVLRATAGRFLDPTTLFVPLFATGWDFAWLQRYRYTTLEYFCNIMGQSQCDDDDVAFLESALGPGLEWTSGDGHDYLLFRPEDRGGRTMLTVDQLGVGRRLQAPYADELVMAWETQVAAQASVEVSWVHKRTRDLIDDTCSSNAWLWGVGPEPDLDDASTWPDRGQCEALVYANLPDLERTYQAWILRLEARRERFQVLASYTLSDSRGNAVSGAESFYAPPTFDDYPTHWVNSDGHLGDHRRHRVKLNGFLRLPWHLGLGVDGFWSSEGHQTVWASCQSFADAFQNPNAVEQMNQLGIDPGLLRYCYDGAGNLSDRELSLRPRGDLRTKSTWQVHVQLTKTLQVRDLDLQAILTVYNLFDRELDLSFNSQAFLEAADEDGEPLYDQNGNAVLVPVGAATAYREPRRYEIGFRLEF